jgi:hypothetical protein
VLGGRGSHSRGRGLVWLRPKGGRPFWLVPDRGLKAGERGASTAVRAVR